MAAKQSGGMNSVLTWGAALVGVYLLYRFFFAPKTAQAASLGNPVLTGGGTGYVQYPGAAAQGSQQTGISSILQNLMNAIRNAKGGGGVSFGAGPGGPTQGGGGPQSTAALQAQINAISTDSFLANNMPLADLGGNSLVTYSPTDQTYLNDLGGYQLGGQQSSNNQLDLTQWGTPIDWSTISGSGGMGGFDPTAPIDTTGLDTTGLSGVDLTGIFGG